MIVLGKRLGSFWNINEYKLFIHMKIIRGIKMINDTLFFMLIVGIIISAGMLILFIWAAKSGQFDDSNKIVNGLLFDSVDDLNDAINKEKNLKEAKAEKLKNETEKEKIKEEN